MENTTEVKPIIDKENLAIFKNHIDQGILLIKAEKFEEAIDHFLNNEIPPKVGIELSDQTKDIYIDQDFQSEPQMEDIISLQAYYSHFCLGKNNFPTEIKISRVWTAGPEVTGKPRPKIPQRVWHNNALVAVEEWLHALQYLKGSLTGEENTELDVAIYMKNMNIPLTKEFMSRQGRQNYFSKKLK